ncbi:MAG: hypothetical protein J5685_10580 [Clostridiales bacterium]|nr:hypothetical protein [Clostridiales bacterium]
MERLTSARTLIKWIYCGIAAAAACIALILGSKMFFGLLFFMLSFTGVTGAILFDKGSTARKVSVLIVWGLCLAACILLRTWWAGLIFTVPVLVTPVRNPYIRVFMVFGGAVSGFVLSVLRDMPGRAYMLIFPVILILYSVMFLFGCALSDKSEESEQKLGKALQAASLDSLNERRLREELAMQKALAEKNARLAERERISRDIHNSVGHTLSAASVTLDAAALIIDKDTALAADKMEQANSRVKEAIGSIRSAVRTLDGDDTILVSDYVESLKKRISEFSMDTDIKVHHNLDNIKEEGSIDMDTAAFLSGALSELLTNGMKHGSADVFVVVLTLDSRHISLKVQDNGKGWGDIAYEEKQRLLNEGFGLRKISDHVKSSGGNMSIDGKDGFDVNIDMIRLDGTEEKDG